MDRVDFWDKVKKFPGDKACWEWQSYCDKDGYGRVTIDGKTQGAHRVSYDMANGDLDPNLVVLHRCDNPPCVRPEHLYQDTAQKNNLDKELKNRQVRGESNGTAKLNDQAIRDIKELWSQGMSQTDIAEIWQVSQPMISNIIRKKNWLHVDEDMIGKPKEKGMPDEDNEQSA
jgi:predicted XRE-type DNA-binding protein